MNEIISVEQSTAQAIMDTLMREATNDRRRETLSRLQGACAILMTKARPIKIRDVQREILQAHGKDAGPKAQSISNERDRRLGMYHYVMACERERLTASSGSARVGRPAKRQDVVDNATHKIKDIDIRSTMFDLHDRCILAEKELARAKVLLKTLDPGADVTNLIERTVPSAGRRIDGTYVEALRHLLNTLSDNAKLETVGLKNDGKRIKRKTGTSDELIDMKTIAILAELLPPVNSKQV